MGPRLTLERVEQCLQQGKAEAERLGVQAAIVVVDALGAFREVGVEHVVFETSTQSHHSTLATMEAFMQKVQPQLA